MENHVVAARRSTAPVTGRARESFGASPGNAIETVAAETNPGVLRSASSMSAPPPGLPLPTRGHGRPAKYEGSTAIRRAVHFPAPGASTTTLVAANGSARATEGTAPRSWLT